MKGYRKYFCKKIVWFLITFVIAVLLNFILPRLMPGDPVAVITGKMAQGISDTSAVKELYEGYARQFGTDKPMAVQFVTYFKNAVKGDFGLSFSQYPRPVSDIISDAIWWTICLQFPAIIVGWLLGNLLGALAAYIRKGFDKVLLPVSLFCSSIPAFGMAVILLGIFAIKYKISPVSGGYGFDMIPNFSWNFVKSVIAHYQLPFWSIVLISIGGQAIGMRSMSIYELNADYVKYSRFLGIKDRKIVGYVFRNAMLPQITGLAFP
jgi:peptide/nickel transport system permease protein